MRDTGAHYFRCDFQVHTPRDLRWHGLGATTDEERRTYAEEFVAACRSKSLQAVAITDHHDVALFRWIKAAAASETDANGASIHPDDRLVVFPGMELTLGVPCQALLLLDAEFPVDLLEQVPMALSVTPAPAADAKHGEIIRLEQFTDFEQLYDQLSQRDFLRDRFVILPNVNEGGNSTLMRPGFAVKYKSMPCVGGYVDGSITQHGNGNRDKVAGKVKEWGNKPLGLFQTSDNRRRDFADLGKHTTWVKWARPTAEAIRQACLARESRLAQAEPLLPTIHITRLEVSNSHFLGPISLNLNPQYNAMIGGRGTGKSTVLEYIRWGLCDQPPTERDIELVDFQRRRKALVQNTLEALDATVTVTFLKNGIPHVVRRKTGTNETLLKIGADEFEPCSEEDVRKLLRIQAYSQKQLSSVGVRVEELERFIHAPISEELAALSANRDDVAKEAKAAYADATRHRALTSEIANLELQRRSLNEQVKSLRENLKGLNEDDAKLIAEESDREEESQVVEGWEADLERAQLSLSELLAEFAEAPTSQDGGPELPNKALLEEMRGALSTWFQTFRETVAALAKTTEHGAVGSSLAPYFSALERWKSQREKSRQAYVEAKERSSAHETTLAQIADAEDRLKKLDTSLGEKRRALQKLGDPAARFAAQRKRWIELQTEAFDLVAKQCEELTKLSKGLIRAKVLRGHRTEALDERLRLAFKGTKIRGERFEKLCLRVREATDSTQELGAILDELELLAMAEGDGDSKVALPSTPLLDSCDFSTRDKQAIAYTLTQDEWLELLLTETGDLPDFEYRAREGDYIKFSMASAGQQATALMYVLLNQGGPPLVIDQPEDDLDNKVMDEIVREIWQAKSRRQLIFSSHNANLVVNGDSELVVVCDYRVAGDQSGGKIKLEGAIDIPEINAEVAAVMEGGREAFSLRRAKYGF